MQVELAIYEALQSVNVPAERARAVAESVVTEIDRRYDALTKNTPNNGELAKLESRIESLRGDVKTDIARVEGKIADLSKQIADSQRWIILTIFASISAFAALQKLLA